MPAYSFKKQFAAPIIAGTKGGTIRAARKNAWQVGARPGGHARPGETLYLYTGMRTKHCVKIAEKPCIAVEPIHLHFDGGPMILLPQSSLMFNHPDDLQIFAVFDGFATFDDMARFWEETHATAAFRGWHIRWLEIPDA